MQLLAEMPVWDPGNMGDMDVRQAILDVGDGRAMVAMLGIDTVQMGEDAPMDCDSDYMERDILIEFETVDGMPVYYGGDCYDSDWEDPRDLAYVDWVDWSDFNAPEEYGGDLPDMQDIGLPKAVDATVMMVGEVTSLGHERQELSSYSLPAADMVITEPVADILIVGRDIPVMAESPDNRTTFDPDLLNTFETVGGMPVYYGGDLNDSDCESVGDHDLDTWEDWGDSDLIFGIGIMAFPRIPKIHSRRLYSVPMCFGVRTWSSRHECGQTFGMCLYRGCRLSPIQW